MDAPNLSYAYREYIDARNFASLARSRWLVTMPPWEDAAEELDGEMTQIRCAKVLAEELHHAKIAR